MHAHLNISHDGWNSHSTVLQCLVIAAVLGAFGLGEGGERGDAQGNGEPNRELEVDGDDLFLGERSRGGEEGGGRDERNLGGLRDSLLGVSHQGGAGDGGAAGLDGGLGAHGKSSGVGNGEHCCVCVCVCMSTRAKNERGKVGGGYRVSPRPIRRPLVCGSFGLDNIIATWRVI